MASFANDTAFALMMLLFVFSETTGWLPVFAMAGVLMVTTLIYGVVRPAKMRRDPPPDAP
jgi:ABC-type Fe3+-siderophore transport system permease subunit